MFPCGRHTRPCARPLTSARVWGCSSFGHYVAVVKGDGDRWYLVDDGKCEPVLAADVLGAPVYMLFYQRRAPRSADTAVLIPALDATVAAAAAALDNLAVTPSEETAVAPARGPCAGGCGFFGDPETRGYCSKCFGTRFPEESLARRAAADARCAEQSQESLANDQRRLAQNYEILLHAQRLEMEAARAAAAPAAPAKAVPKRKLGPNDPCDWCVCFFCSLHSPPPPSPPEIRSLAQWERQEIQKMPRQGVPVKLAPEYFIKSNQG